MKLSFAHTVSFKASSNISPDLLAKLPETIYQNTNFEYTYEATDTGCRLTPTFRNMPYGNSFVPEIDIMLSEHEGFSMLHITGQPVKTIRIFAAFCSICSLLLAIFALVVMLISKDNILFVLAPIGMSVFSYFFCKLGTKATFNYIIKAIKNE